MDDHEEKNTVCLVAEQVTFNLCGLYDPPIVENVYLLSARVLFWPCN